MNVYEAIRERRSVRAFKKESIPEDQIKTILDAGRWAPTGCNKQLYEVIHIEDPKLRRRAARLSNNQVYFYQAPVMLLVLYDNSKELEPKGVAPDVPAISSGAFVQNMLLQAKAFGIDSLVVSAITKKEKLRNLMNIPSCYEPMCFVFFGYRDEETYPPPRREIEDFVHRNKFGNLLTGKKRAGALYPNSPDPEKWTWKELVEFKQAIIHYAGPMGNCEPIGLNSMTMDLLDIVSMRMKHRLTTKALDIFPTEGLFLRSLTSRIAPSNDMQLSAVEFSPLTAQYMKHVLHKDEIPCKVEAIAFSENNEVAFPFNEEAFDAVTCFFRLENVPSRMQILRESWRVLQEDGFMAVAFFNRWGAIDVTRRILSFNKPYDFNKRWHWLVGPWSAPTKRGLLKEMGQVGFEPKTVFQFYDLSSILKIGGSRLSSLLGVSLAKKSHYSGFVKKTGLFPSVALIEAQKPRG